MQVGWHYTLTVNVLRLGRQGLVQDPLHLVPVLLITLTQLPGLVHYLLLPRVGSVEGNILIA